jgi:hypothetical protein
MRRKNFMNPCKLAVIAALLSGGAANAQDGDGPWYKRTDVQGLLGSYEDSTERDRLQNFGVFLRADYLERGGFTVGVNRTVLNGGAGIEDISQSAVFLSGRRNLTPDWASGQITLRLDGHVVSNDDATGDTDDVRVIAPQISYLNFARTFYADIGFSRSSYGDSLINPQALEVDQVTPTLGFGFNEQRDWLQLRGYFISPSAPQRAQNEDETAALEIKWTHWPTTPSLLNVDNYRVAVLAGERIYAVDHDAGIIFNLVDLQTGGLSLGAEWAPSERNRILLIAGVEQYEDRIASEEYEHGFLYLNFTHEWN